MYGVPYMAVMHRTTIYLDEHTHERLQRLAEASGRTQAAVIREAIAVYSSARGGPRVPRSVGLGASSSGDLSERAEELLDGFGEES
jgi:predicted transcriptional regulator